MFTLGHLHIRGELALESAEGAVQTGLHRAGRQPERRGCLPLVEFEEEPAGDHLLLRHRQPA